LRIAVEILEPLGICGLIGGSPPGSEVQLDMLSILLGRGLRGIIQGDSIPKIFIPQLIQFYEEGRFPFDKMIQFYEGLEQINKACQDTKTTAIKPVLRISKV